MVQPRIKLKISVKDHNESREYESFDCLTLAKILVGCTKPYELLDLIKKAYKQNANDPLASRCDKKDLEDFLALFGSDRAEYEKVVEQHKKLQMRHNNLLEKLHTLSSSNGERI